MSSFTVLFDKILETMTSPNTTGAADPLTPSCQKAGQNHDQIATGTAMLHLAAESPKTRGTVQRARRLSPAWSYMSCDCMVVEITRPINRSQWYATGLKNSTDGSDQTSIAPDVKHIYPQALMKFLVMQLLSAPLRSLYQ